MFKSSKQNVSDFVLEALSKSLAVIEFKPDGTIITANPNFLNALGYELSEVQGKHHSMFIEPSEVSSPEYKKFWADLAAGKFQAAEYKRIGKGGKEVWIQASYNPVADDRGCVLKVVKFATDTTEEKLKNAEYEGKIDAISKAQAVIEFELDGTIIRANKNFLDVLGYTAGEVEGKHHSMFIEPSEVSSPEYKKFWADLAAGKFQAAEYKRIGKGGKEVWIQASYNPIFDMNGRPFKVVKYATDVTDAVHKRHEFERIVRFVNDGLEKVGFELENSTGEAASASAQTSSVVQTVAAAAEELNGSIQEISRSVNMSQSSVEKAIDLSNNADQYTARLTDAAEAMTGIVALIEDITSQINLLSLNATIESARAGEAGKGFAVVANEVKNLAGQAKDAALQISEEISNMQGVSSDVVTSMRSIREAIDSVMGGVNTVASAIEEQTSVTSEISSNMQMAAQSTESIDRNIHDIVGVSNMSKETAKEIKEKLSVLSAA